MPFGDGFRCEHVMIMSHEVMPPQCFKKRIVLQFLPADDDAEQG